jgi:hypothetical protein
MWNNVKEHRDLHFKSIESKLNSKQFDNKIIKVIIEEISKEELIGNLEINEVRR